MWSCHNQLTLFQSAEDGSVSPSGTRYYQPLVVWPAGVSLPGSFICGQMPWQRADEYVGPGPSLEQIGGRDGACFSSFVSQGLQISQSPTEAFL